MKIYIPIWLDLLYYFLRKIGGQDGYLHSNMVRFIIQTTSWIVEH